MSFLFSIKPVSFRSREFAVKQQLPREYGVVKSIPIRPNDILLWVAESWEARLSHLRLTAYIHSSCDNIPVMVLIFDFVPNLDSRLASFPCSNPLLSRLEHVCTSCSLMCWMLYPSSILSIWLSFLRINCAYYIASRKGWVKHIYSLDVWVFLSGSFDPPPGNIGFWPRWRRRFFFSHHFSFWSNDRLRGKND